MKESEKAINIVLKLGACYNAAFVQCSIRQAMVYLRSQRAVNN